MLRLAQDATCLQPSFVSNHCCIDPAECRHLSSMMEYPDRLLRGTSCCFSRFPGCERLISFHLHKVLHLDQKRCSLKGEKRADRGKYQF